MLQDTMINLPIEALPQFGISNICFNPKQPDFPVSLWPRLTLIKQASQRPSGPGYEATATRPSGGQPDPRPPPPGTCTCTPAANTRGRK